jgi:aspartate racemase
MNIRTLGLVGGIGPESTVDYYRQIISVWRRRHPDAPYPRLIINSIDLKTMLRLVSAGDFLNLVSYLTAELNRIVAAGAEVALFASNTPHLVFDDLRRHSSIPLLSIVEAARAHAKTLGLSRLGLFGLRFTMEARFYADVFAAEGMTVVSPTPAEQETIHTIYLGELVPGVFKPESRDRLLDIAAAMRHRESIDGLILGGTELPLLLRGSEVPECPFLDTAAIHVEAAVDHILDASAHGS